MESLRWLGLIGMKGRIFSRRTWSATTAANLLLENKKAYCYCTRKRAAGGQEEARRKGEAYLCPGKWKPDS